jgi:hypothetical protein
MGNCSSNYEYSIEGKSNDIINPFITAVRQRGSQIKITGTMSEIGGDSLPLTHICTLKLIPIVIKGSKVEYNHLDLRVDVTNYDLMMMIHTRAIELGWYFDWDRRDHKSMILLKRLQYIPQGMKWVD